MFDTTAVTVQDVLREQHLALGDNDRIDPPLFAEIGRSATITVTRVTLTTENVAQPIPFARTLVRDETYPQSQIRVLQLGANGMTTITYTITTEDGKETARHETARAIVVQPKDEILAVGTQGSLPNVALPSGSIVYLANGNAWVMRRTSDEKRPLTSTSDLDGRVFSLSADGRYVLFSRDAPNALNAVWLMDTVVLGETPRALPIHDALTAQLSPDAKTIAFSTGEKTPGAPGWKAHNDLWILPITPSDANAEQKPPVEIWKPSDPAPYSWWGANYAWSPDGRSLAFAFANEIGFVDFTRGFSADAKRYTLKKFAPFRAREDWVWTPQVAWSPDNRFVIGVVHQPLGNAAVATDEPTFEVWALARDGSVTAPLAKQTGMWALPQWSPPDARGESRIAFGIAREPSNSERSRYALSIMDRDGGNKKQIFPLATAPVSEGLVVPQTAWSPDAKQLVAVRDGDLWLYDFAANKWSQLTANGASALPRWTK